jgi:hypothetical protein
MLRSIVAHNGRSDDRDLLHVGRVAELIDDDVVAERVRNAGRRKRRVSYLHQEGDNAQCAKAHLFRFCHFSPLGHPGRHKVEIASSGILIPKNAPEAHPQKEVTIQAISPMLGKSSSIAS